MMMGLLGLLNQRLPVSIAAGLAALAVILALVFMLQPAGGGPVISQSDAIDAAMAEVENDGVMALDGRDTVIEADNGDWHVYFPLSIVPQVVWGDVDCSGEIEGGDALGILRDVGELEDDPPDGCPDVGTTIDPAAICTDPICSTAPRGGEPHVIIDGGDGSVVEIYYTQ